MTSQGDLLAQGGALRAHIDEQTRIAATMAASRGKFEAGYSGVAPGEI